MKLQVALDCNFSVVSALSLLEKIADCVDIIEAGTPFIVESGLLLVRQLKEAFPEKQVSADLKIADAGHYEASRAFEAGADIATVLAMADDVTIMNARDAAHELGREIMVDMLNTQNLEERIARIDAFGVDYICLHTSKDLQKVDRDACRAFEKLRKCVKNSKLALAGGISPENIEQFASIKPDVIIVGEAITAADDPVGAARAICTAMGKYGC